MLKFVLGSCHIGITECRREESNTMHYDSTKTVIFVSQKFLMLLTHCECSVEWIEGLYLLHGSESYSTGLYWPRISLGVNSL